MNKSACDDYYRSAAADVPPTFKKSRRFQNEHSLSKACVSYIWRNRSIGSRAPQNDIGHVERCGQQRTRAYADRFSGHYGVLFGVPLLTMPIAWIGLISRWRTVKYQAMRLLVSIAMIFPTAAALLACGGLAYVQRGGIVHDTLRFYGDGFVVSLAGVLLGVGVAIALRRWFSLAALAVSTWMFLVFAIMGSAAD